MKFNYYSSPQIQKFAKKCLQIFNGREVGVFLFFPKISHIRRAEYVIQEYKTNYKMIHIDLSAEEADNVAELEFVLNQQWHRIKEKTGIFITNAEFLILQKHPQIIDAIVKARQDNPNLHFILMFSMDITHSLISKYFIRESIFDNINYYPLYNYKEASGFIDYLTVKWQTHIPKKIKHNIINECGGHFWLIKYAIAQYRDNPKITLQDIYKSEQMQFRLEQIVDLLLTSEKNVLIKMIKKELIENDDEKHSLRYLSKMNIIRNNKITIPYIEYFLKENLPRVKLSITDNHILLNNVRVDSHFSRLEKRALRKLVSNRDNIVSREQMANSIWPTDTEIKYTDWAIDRLISRLRDKIISLGVSRNMIKTLRNKGYMFKS